MTECYMDSPQLHAPTCGKGQIFASVIWLTSLSSLTIA